MKDIENKLKELKIAKELPNENNTSFNIGYVMAINDCLNLLKNVSQHNVMERQNATVNLDFKMFGDTILCDTECDSKHKPSVLTNVGSVSCQKCEHNRYTDNHNLVVVCSAPDNVEAAKM